MPTQKKSLKKKILVAVKAYPVLSVNNIETVCTAGICEDGRWIRIFPIPYRFMDKNEQFKKYQWIEAKMERDFKDPRHESHKLTSHIKLCDFIDTSENWNERKKLVLGKVYYNLETLINEARDTNIFTSLATFKPKKIINFKVEEDKTKFSKRIKKKIIKQQIGEERAKYLIDNIDYKFSFTVIDCMGKRSTMQVIDWEMLQLCRKIIKKHGKNKAIIRKYFKEKYFDNIIENKDIYLFLGTNKYWHIRRSKNPFMIVGLFYPSKEANRIIS